MFRNLLNLAVFLVGLVAVCWIGIGYVGSNNLGAMVALLIGACYLAGALELWRYRQATATLQHAVTDLADAPGSLGAWLDRLHPGLRNAVRLRVEGERVAMPSPALTPYLVGLLVLLGMLGTLLGMMATLRGTGIALESATDLQAIRGSLAAPVKGLGFAFGTSIAGVASSAMLGLLSALCRRERLDVVQRLDAKIASTLRVFSRAHQRDESFRLLQQQTETMPALIDRLQAMMATLEQHSQQASERQRASQDAFHASTSEIYTKLAASVEASLKQSVTESARAASAAFQPVVESTMAGLARETASLHDTVTHAVTQQLDGLSSAFAKSTSAVAAIWTGALAEQKTTNENLAKDLREAQDRFAASFEQRSTQLVDGVAARMDSSADHMASAWNDALAKQVRTVQASHDDLQAKLESRDTERLAAWTSSLEAMTAALHTQWEAAGKDVASRQQAICDTLARTAADIGEQGKAHASETIAEISRLVDAASEAPKAAAEVVAELRQKLSDSMVRDTAMLEERSRLLATLETLLDAVNHASTEQRVAVDALVTTSADLLERVSTRFTNHIQGETGKLTSVAAQVTGSAVEVASLGEAFGAAVASFGQSNDGLMERLDVIAAALDKSLERSDEQLAYYVAQAREVVDLSVMSQKQILEDMQRLATQRAPADAETA
ncbi:MAG: DUF802 domain-containing protein [Luteibacter sp.]